MINVHLSGHLLKSQPGDNMRVFCYRNLHKNLHKKGVVWSVRSTKTGRVVDWATHVVIKDAQLVVGQKGRERVVKEQRKNVHAGIRGERIDALPLTANLIRATYNPYKMNTFIIVDTGEPILKAQYALLKEDGLWVVL